MHLSVLIPSSPDIVQDKFNLGKWDQAAMDDEFANVELELSLYLVRCFRWL